MSKVYRYSVKFRDRGVDCVSSLHYQTDVPLSGNEPSPEDVLTQIDQHFSSSGTNMSKWVGLAHTGAVLVETRLYEEVDDPGSTPPTGAVHTYALPGTAQALAADAPPVELCIYISLTTAKLGRSFRGGVHTPPVYSAAMFNSIGQVDTVPSDYAKYTALGTAIVDVLDDVFATTGDIKPVIYSRTRRARGQSFAEDVTAFQVRPQFRWLRRRATAP